MTRPEHGTLISLTVGEQIVSAPATLPSGWHHVAVVIDSAAMSLTLYLDGTAVGTAATTLVITSYSIHYTKLYELRPEPGHQLLDRRFHAPDARDCMA